ncbi:alpha/beta fold hydrolase [Geodermatophilus sp. SYSU D00691]
MDDAAHEAAQPSDAGGAPGHAGWPHLDGVQHRFVQLPDLRMHVAEAGHGEPVVLLHGFGQHWWEWRAVLPALAERYRVICPDLRGAGWTDAPAVGYTGEQQLADVVALLDELGLQQVRLIGHDAGSLVGFDLCLRYPERVHSFVSTGAPHPFARFHPRMLQGGWRLWFQPVIASPVLGPAGLSAGSQWLTRYVFQSFTAPGFTWPEEDLEAFVARLRDPARARAGSALYRQFIVPQIWRIFRGRYRGMRLSTPTRALYGTEDRVQSPEIGAHVLSGYERHADDLALVWVDQAGHYVVDERPDAVVSAAREFLSRS